MEQEKNKVPSQENENPGLEKFQRAQELYERYFISNEEADFEEMITVLDSIYKNRVKSELREKGCCDKENYEDAMQEARQGIWTRIKKQRETGELHKEFSQYCGGIYTYKAVDIAKKKNSYEQKMREVKKKGGCILQSGQMTAETSEKSVFTATHCKSADRRFTITLSVRANHGSISHLLTPC